ncbi:MAG TPA: phage/plasmid primase, P4 family [Pseudonocardiaceae bacterium]|jgi:P4 family phage/plasmid primase-like protien
MTAPTPLHRCAHEQVDIDALLADDRLAAALAAPVVPGTEKNDLLLWLIRLYRYTHNDATVEGACALLHAHPLADGKRMCATAKIIWNRSSELDPLTDTGNGRRLAVVTGGEITHDPAAGWRIWTGSSWQGDPDGTVVQRWSKRVPQLLEKQAEALRNRAQVVAGNGEEGEVEARRLRGEANEIKSWAHVSQCAKLIGAMIKLVRDEPGVLTRSDAWDANPRLLACPDATVELTPDGHVIRRARRADRLTKLTGSRPGTGAPAPLWEAFLARSLPDPEVRLYVQKLVGYGLIAGNPRRLFPIFIGPTSGGKSTFSETVRHALGQYAGPFSLALFRGKMDEGPRTDVLKAIDRRLVFASESSQRWQLHADEVKRLTGNDSVQARDLYAKKDATVERQAAFMPILSCNHPPAILGADPATWRRLVAVPWPVTISETEEDGDLGEKIRTQEADGVLDWLLHGWDLYCAFGLEQPHAVVQETMKLRDSLTIADSWLAGNTEPDESYSVTSVQLWSAYRDYCEGGRIPPEQMGSIKSFTLLLRDRGFTPCKVDQQRGWRGLRLRTSEEFVEPR